MNVLPEYEGGWAVATKDGVVLVDGTYKTLKAAALAAIVQGLVGTIFNIYE